MTTSQLRLHLLKELESLDKKRLEEVYGIILNFINSKKMPSSKLSSYEEAMIDEGIQQLDEGHGIAHEEIMKKYRKKYQK